MQILIKDARVIDPGKLNGIYDIFISDRKIKDIIKKDSSTSTADHGPNCRVVDAREKIVMPGLIDMHVHLREPGHEYKETIETGCQAAAAGGFTAVCCMPNTNPVNDCREITEFIINKAKKLKGPSVYPVGAISKNLKGETLAEFFELKSAGAIAVSDDGHSVMNSQLMRRALEYAKGFGLLVIAHCEDMNLTASGTMNEGALSTQMGLAGIPNASESVMVKRDIELCELTGARLHIAHVSAKESVHAIRQAKQRGVQVTAETAPHYFTLTEMAVQNYNTHAKMNPPLRALEDKEEICRGLADGTIDAIATDHAPHSVLEKRVEFDLAANGIIGLETAVGLSYRLVLDGVITIEQFINCLSVNPAKILGLTRSIQVGQTADLTVFDPNAEFKVDSGKFCSKSRNTPFNGWTMTGKPVITIANGNIIFEN